MRHAFLLGVILLMLPMTLLAETRYVSEVREITLRTGPGGEYKIISMVKSGSPMTVLDQSDDWTQVQLADGKEGWVLTQFLQTKVPDAIVLEKLQKTYTSLSAESDKLKSENKELNEKVTALTANLDSCQSEHNKLNTDYETLKTESTDFLTLQANYKATVKELKAEKEKTEKLEKELSDLVYDKRLWWIIAGACILLTGMILGFILKPQRRRSSLL